MRLLRADCEELKLETFNDERKLPKYAILSHVWLHADEEITFQDLKVEAEELRARAGWVKLDYTRKQAFQDGYEYCWIDTCCIDKSSSAELAEAINSMYRWYNLAEVCYVYLADMPEGMPSANEGQDSHQSVSSEPLSQPKDGAQQDLRVSVSPECSSSDEKHQEEDCWDWNAYGHCRWFTRGWTLQEMLTPTRVQFYSKCWLYIGSLCELADRVSRITGVHMEALQRRWPLVSYSIAQRMSWASRRETTKLEDQAYSLLGIFDVNLPIIYGEGEKAFARLQMELLRAYSDQTVFSWLVYVPQTGEDICYKSDELAALTSVDLLAKSPIAFENCGRFVPTEKHDLHLDRRYELVDKGVRFDLPTRWLCPSPRIYHPRRWLRPPMLTSRRIDNLNHRLAARKWYRNDYFPQELLVALDCCCEDNPTLTLTLLIRKVPDTRDTYLPLQCSLLSRQQSTWRNTEACPNVTRCFTVLHTATKEKRRPRIQLNEQVVSCCVTHRSDVGVEITSGEPAELWNSESSSFFLSQVGRAEFPESPFHGSVVLRTPLAQGATTAFVLNISIWKDDQGWWHKLYFDGHEGARVFQLQLTPFSNIIITRTTEAPWCSLLIVGAEFKAKSLNHQEIILIEANAVTVGVFDLLWLILISASRIIFAFLLLPMAVVLPVLIPAVLRLQAYKAAALSGGTLNPSGGPNVHSLAISATESNGLIAGLLATSAVSAWLLLDSKLYLHWRPISWQGPVLCLLRVASIVISALFRSQHSALLPLALRASTGRVDVWAMIFITIVRPILLSGCFIWDLVNFFMRVPFRSVKIGVYVLHLAFNVLSLAAVGAVVGLLTHRTSLLPWTAQACVEGHIPEHAAVYIVDDLGPVISVRQFVELCNDASSRARYLYTLLILGCYLGLLEFVALLQTICWSTRSEKESIVRRNKLQRFTDRCRPWRTRESRIRNYGR